MNIIDQLTEWQMRIIEANVSAFYDDLQTEALYEFDSTKQEWAKSGRVFLHVNSRGRYYDYPTDLGWFADARRAADEIYKYIGVRVAEKRLAFKEQEAKRAHDSREAE